MSICVFMSTKLRALSSWPKRDRALLSRPERRKERVSGIQIILFYFFSEIMTGGNEMLKMCLIDLKHSWRCFSFYNPLMKMLIVNLWFLCLRAFFVYNFIIIFKNILLYKLIKNRKYYRNIKIKICLFEKKCI